MSTTNLATHSVQELPNLLLTIKQEVPKDGTEKARPAVCALLDALNPPLKWTDGAHHHLVNTASGHGSQ